MAGQTKDLTVGNPTRLIILFTLPLLAGNVFQQLYSMADMVIVGQTIGTNALAAIGATGSMSFLVIGLSFGLTSGFSVITAQRFGAEDEDGVRQSVASSVALTLVLSLLVTLASVLTARPLLRLLDTPGDIIDDSHLYLLILYAGTIATMFFNLSSGILRALGDTFTPLLFLIVACVVNIALDYILIVNFGMGVAGAAWRWTTSSSSTSAWASPARPGPPLPRRRSPPASASPTASAASPFSACADGTGACPPSSSGNSSPPASPWARIWSSSPSA